MHNTEIEELFKPYERSANDLIFKACTGCVGGNITREERTGCLVRLRFAKFCGSVDLLFFIIEVSSKFT